MKVHFLTRRGSKRAISDKIINHFPEHNFYVEPFFGAGGLYFNKPLATTNILADADEDVFNLYMVILNQKEEFHNLISNIIPHQSLLNYWKKNKETDPLKRALRFIFLSNFTLYGASTLNIAINRIGSLLANIDTVYKMLQKATFYCCDFRKLPNVIEKKWFNDKMFWYADPPYLATSRRNYNDANKFSKQDFCDLLDMLVGLKCKFAVSEFDNDFVIEQAKQRDLNINYITRRQNIKNFRNEILITNYKTGGTLF